MTQLVPLCSCYFTLAYNKSNLDARLGIPPSLSLSLVSSSSSFFLLPFLRFLPTFYHSSLPSLSPSLLSFCPSFAFSPLLSFSPSSFPSSLHPSLFFFHSLDPRFICLPVCPSTYHTSLYVYLSRQPAKPVHLLACQKASQPY